MTAGGRNPQAHLELLELDALRAGEALPAVAAAHAAWCGACAAALAELGAAQTALRAMPATLAVPAPRQAAILAAARAQAARVRRLRRRLVSAAVAAAAVAVLTTAALLRVPVTRHAGAPLVVAAAPGKLAAHDADSSDLDGDGRVTVLDAFALARAGDVDPERLDALLAMAVSLENPR